MAQCTEIRKPVLSFRHVAADDDIFHAGLLDLVLAEPETVTIALRWISLRTFS